MLDSHWVQLTYPPHIPQALLHNANRQVVGCEANYPFGFFWESSCVMTKRVTELTDPREMDFADCGD